MGLGTIERAAKLEISLADVLRMLRDEGYPIPGNKYGDKAPDVSISYPSEYEHVTKGKLVLTWTETAEIPYRAIAALPIPSAGVPVTKV